MKTVLYSMLITTLSACNGDQAKFKCSEKERAIAQVTQSTTGAECLDYDTGRDLDYSDGHCCPEGFELIGWNGETAVCLEECR